jgi:2-(1,2-epoxy-1,2-dihydrophenyl)acetyl-CoA isomerase
MSALPLPVLLEFSGAIARISFNRPEVLNAIDRNTAEAFLSSIEQIIATPAVRVVLLRGEGRAFMAGGDLAPLLTEPVHAAAELIDPLHSAMRLMAAMPQPVVASVQGAVAGAGMSLMLAADLAIAADNASFNMAYAKIGASPDVSGSWHLPRVVGLRQAMEIALLADTLDAASALRLSLVNRVVPAASLEAETNELLERLANGPTFAFGQIKQLLRASQSRTLPEQLDAERAAFLACAGSQDFSEGLAAFFGKRKPVYRGN